LAGLEAIGLHGECVFVEGRTAEIRIEFVFILLVADFYVHEAFITHMSLTVGKALQ
jgi:hypothetical protein